MVCFACLVCVSGMTCACTSSADSLKGLIKRVQKLEARFSLELGIQP